MELKPEEQILAAALDLFRLKNEEYGNAIVLTGALGAAVALTGDVGKLRAMVIKNTGHGREAAWNVEDKFFDVLVQAMIGILMVRNQNWEGIDL
jgi:hypothetical protein